MIDPAILRQAVPADAPHVAHVLIESRRAFLPFAPSAHPPDEVRTWVRDELMATRDVHVAEVGGRIVGVLATSRGDSASWIEQLFILPGYDGKGLGSQLIQIAHDTLGGPIRAYTFQANAGARRFYERHGYKAIEFTDGSGNEEHCPDVLYERTA